MPSNDDLQARIVELEAEIAAHRRAAMMIFLEYAARRPAERVHLIALLSELVTVMGPKAASISEMLIAELSTGADGTGSVAPH